jgi:hypothetical protein
MRLPPISTLLNLTDRHSLFSRVSGVKFSLRFFPVRGELPSQSYMKNYAGLVEAYTNPGTVGSSPDVATTTANNGKPPSPAPRMKQEPGTPRETQQLTKTRGLMSPL